MSMDGCLAKEMKLLGIREKPALLTGDRVRPAAHGDQGVQRASPGHDGEEGPVEEVNNQLVSHYDAYQYLQRFVLHQVVGDLSVQPEVEGDDPILVQNLLQVPQSHKHRHEGDEGATSQRIVMPTTTNEPGDKVAKLIEDRPVAVTELAAIKTPSNHAILVCEDWIA
eukprot:CAMPEP_0175174168 /NCGR_PEP_ID=MMETSP0087-20121206/32477_1 /TAXON_ID=136419 /ORGANISM="Unknown Unknown, Strain D1" /LENGTH=166 /DNA_ID=CAMNT_0016465597 /DNA_START=456 /DNA_END=957 /DNA_ORIENTATION=+